MVPLWPLCVCWFNIQLSRVINRLLIVLGWILCIFVSPPHKVIRSDGTTAGPPPSGASSSISASIKREYQNFVTALTNWRILLLIPAFFCANFFYSYQQNTVNGMHHLCYYIYIIIPFSMDRPGATFTLRTRSLNGAMYWIAQMVS